MTIDAESFEIQRWRSAGYVESWVANQNHSSERSSLRKKLVSLLPFEPDASIRVLDLGAGAGALSLEVLSVYPKAQIVCQDFSEVMLAHARQQLARFTGQVTFIQSDLANPDWVQAIPGTFDAAVTSLVMHTVPARVREIYREVFGLLNPGGCFLITDMASPSGPVLEKLFLQARLKDQQARIKAETGTEKSLEEIEQELKERRQGRNAGTPERKRNPLRRTLTLMNHLEWLKQAGFAEEDCLWKDLNHAVIGGFKHPDPENPGLS